MAAEGDEILAELVHQFTDRFAFWRELIQNSIDAGSSRIEVTLRYQPGAAGAGGLVTASVQDWGEGMNRSIIERFLLTKFRSSKEGDLTKIGKFGIGFMSVFAPGPQLVVVETGRDGEDWRLLLHPDRSYELLRSPEPLEGTRVSLHLELGPEAYRYFADRSRDAVERWCRHSEADVAFAAGGEDGSAPGPAAPVRQPLEVHAPFQVEHREEGLLIVAGPARTLPPFCGFYNRGLTLLETTEDLVPRVTFKVVSNQLEHTLTRDNVKRDHHFDRVIARLRRLADGAIRDRVRTELRAAAAEERPADHLALLRYATARGFKPRELWFRQPGGPPVDGRTVKKAARRHDAVLVASVDDPLAAALRARGVPVLQSGDTAELAAAIAERPVVAALKKFTLAEAGQPAPAEEALIAALGPLLELAGARVDRAVVATVFGAHTEQPAVPVEAPGVPIRADKIRSPFRWRAPDVLCLNRIHPTVAAAVELAGERPRLAALLCARLVAAREGVLDERIDRRLTAAALGGSP